MEFKMNGDRMILAGTDDLDSIKEIYKIVKQAGEQLEDEIDEQIENRKSDIDKVESCLNNIVYAIDNTNKLPSNYIKEQLNEIASTLGMVWEV